MGLLETLKSMLGLETSEDRDGGPADDRDVGITVEREGQGHHAVEEQAAGERGADAGTGTTDGDSSTTTPDADGADAATSDDEPSSAETAPDDEESAVPAEAVDVIRGIGPTYAGRLADAGIETVDDLAAADAEEVADRVDVPEGRLGEWIERARDYSR